MSGSEDKIHGGKERRSMRWVDPKFQKHYALVLLTFVLFISGMVVGTYWYHSQMILKGLEEFNISSTSSLYGHLQNEIDSLLWSVYFIVGIFCIFVVIASNFLSHRIVGPIYSIKRSLERLINGNAKEARIKLRKGDEFQDVADLVNKLADKMEK